MVGPRQPADVHALGHWINAQVQAPVDFTEPIDTHPQSHAASLQDLANELQGGRIETLVVLDANPAYDTSATLDIATGISRVPFSVHLGLHDDETAAHCHWHLPLSHALESWSDLRAIDGTASIVQPLIRPLYDSRDAHEFLAMAAGQLAPSSYDLVRQTWQAQSGAGDFEAWWRRALHDGVIASSAAAKIATPAPATPNLAPAEAAAGMTLLLGADPSLWDGRFANNAWLQECPKPMTKEVWGNSFALSSADAAQLRCLRRRRYRGRARQGHRARTGDRQARSGRWRYRHLARLWTQPRGRHRQWHRLRRISAAFARKLVAERKCLGEAHRRAPACPEHATSFQARRRSQGPIPRP